MKALVTGFEPFGDWTENPSARVAQALHGRPIGGAQVIAAVLPVVFATAGDRLVALLDQEEPDVVLSLGLGGGSALRVERIAVNLDDSPGRSDNAGAVVGETAIDPAGPAAYFATLPVTVIVHRLRELGIPAVVSNSAGTFLCNHVMYCTLHHLARWARRIPAGFIHLPALPEMVAASDPSQPSMALELQLRGIQIALETVHDIILAESNVAYPVS
jgi:pyroglutamyl-peptidase